MGYYTKAAKRILNIYILFNVIFIGQVSCGHRHGQKKNQVIDTVKIENKQMKKFDIGGFDRNMIKQPDSFCYNFTDSDGSEITQGYEIKEGLLGEGYVIDKNNIVHFEEIKREPNGYEYYFRYSKKGNLIEKLAHYSIGLEVGIWETYDDKGNVTSHIDKDAGYKYSLDSVILFGRENGVDFAKMGDIQRRFDSGEYKRNIWELSWVVDGAADDSEGYQEHYIIDGNTGDVLKHNTTDPPRRLPS